MNSVKTVTLIKVLICMLLVHGGLALAQKGKQKPAPPPKPPVTQPPTTAPADGDIGLDQLPAQTVVRDGDKIFQILVEAPTVYHADYTVSWTCWDNSSNGHGGMNFDAGPFTSFHAERAGSKINLLFFAAQSAAFDSTHASISLVGQVEIETYYQPLSILTSGTGLIRFDVTDGSRPGSRIASRFICTTPQRASAADPPVQCASGIPPGHQSPIDVHQ